MTDQTLTPAHRKVDAITPAAFAVAVFTSASLVFVVQPMTTKLVLPLLGGSPSVWNTAMVFFQAALLAGYLYAHLLQRIPSIRVQAVIHLVLLAVAALFLPLSITQTLGDPDPAAPIRWRCRSALRSPFCQPRRPCCRPGMRASVQDAPTAPTPMSCTPPPIWEASWPCWPIPP